MAAVARFQGGMLDGQEVDLPEGLPIQSYIVTDSVPALGPVMDSEHPLRQTYKRAGQGWNGHKHIVIYRLEG